MNQIRIAALNDLKRVTPAVHYMMRPFSIDADLELTRSLLGDPIGLTLQELRAAEALNDWALCEKTFRAISDTAFPVRDSSDSTPAPGMTFDEERKIWGRREFSRRSALVYARMLGDAQLIELYQTPAPAPVASESASDGMVNESNLSWWQTVYDIRDMAQNIGAKFQSEQKRPSNATIAKEIEKRINDIERSKGRNRTAPNHDTIRGKLTGWAWRPE